jgi:MFS family permease
MFNKKTENTSGENITYTKVLISACLMIGASMGMCFYSMGAMYDPLAQAMSISFGQASLSTSLLLVFMAAGALAMPALLKKISFQHLISAGTIICAASAFGMAFSFHPTAIYIFSALQGLGAAAIGLVPATTLLNNWFVEKRAWVVSIATACSALVTAIVSPLLSYCVGLYDWRMCFVIQAIAILVLMFPVLAFHIPLHPSVIDSIPYGEQSAEHQKTEGSMVTLECFGLIAVCSALLIGLPLHFSSMSSSAGFGAVFGAQMLSLAMIGNIVFKLLGGWLSEKFRPAFSIAVLDVIALIGTIGLLCGLAFTNLPVLACFAVLYGAVFALNELALPLLVSARFKKASYTRIYSLLNFVSMLFTALSIGSIGFLYDAFKTYSWILAIAILLEAVVLGLLWLLIAPQTLQKFKEKSAEKQAKKHAAQKIDPETEAEPVQEHTESETQEPVVLGSADLYPQEDLADQNLQEKPEKTEESAAQADSSAAGVKKAASLEQQLQWVDAKPRAEFIDRTGAKAPDFASPADTAAKDQPEDAKEDASALE